MLHVTGHTIGRDAFIDYDIIIPLSVLFNDPKDIVRKNTHLAFEIVSHTGIGKYSNGVCVGNMFAESKQVFSW